RHTCGTSPGSRWTRTLRRRPRRSSKSWDGGRRPLPGGFPGRHRRRRPDLRRLAAGRDRLSELAFDVYGKLLAHQWKAGLLTKAVDSTRRLLAIDPLQEDAHQVLMRFYIAQGRLDRARREYDTCARMLRREFGVEPQPETKALLADIAARRPVRKPRPPPDW